MATATKKRVTAGAVSDGALGGSELASQEFVVYQDNGGNFHWEIVSESGQRLARSGIFTSQDDARRGARSACDAVGTVRLAPLPAEQGSPGAV